MPLKAYNTIPANPKIVPTDVLISAYGMQNLIKLVSEGCSTSHSNASVLRSSSFSLTLAKQRCLVSTRARNSVSFRSTTPWSEL